MPLPLLAALGLPVSAIAAGVLVLDGTLAKPPDEPTESRFSGRLGETADRS